MKALRKSKDLHYHHLKPLYCYTTVRELYGKKNKRANHLKFTENSRFKAG